MKTKIFIFIALIAICVLSIQGQSTEFTYQGRLLDNTLPPTANYDFEFSLWDSLVAGSQQGTTQTVTGVAVANGIFTVRLDFGAQFSGPPRFLQIAMRAAGGGAYTTLAPRQPFSSAPYAIRSLNATNADTATTATTATTANNATQLNGQTAAFYQNATNINAGTLNAARLPVPFTLVGTSGTHIIRGENASTNSGSSGVSGVASALTGPTTGVSGRSSSTGGFGVSGSAIALTGFTYGVFGYSASTNGVGVSGVADAPTGFTKGVIGQSSSPDGIGVSGLATALTGATSGVSGQSSSPDGRGVFGSATAPTGITYGVYGQSESTNGLGVYGFAGAPTGFTRGVFGQSDSTNGLGVYGFASALTGLTRGVSGNSQSTDGIGVVGTATAPTGSTRGVLGQSDSTDGYGVFGLASAATGSTTGVYGRSVSLNGAGVLGEGDNIGVRGNTFAVNGYAGYFTGPVGSRNYFQRDVGIGTFAPQSRLHVNGTGWFSGDTTPLSGAAGSGVAVGMTATSGYLFGFDYAAFTPRDMTINLPGGNVGIGVAPSDKLHVGGIIRVDTLGAAGSTQLCRNASNQIATCSSSLRYKTNIARFSLGLSFVNRLNPISYDWKDGGMKDVGFGAEDIAKIDPRFVTFNAAGEVEGVKYDRLSVAFVNAFKEQQTEISELRAASSEQAEKIKDQNSKIEAQQKQLDALKKLVCLQNPAAEVCKEEK